MTRFPWMSVGAICFMAIAGCVEPVSEGSIPTPSGSSPQGPYERALALDGEAEISANVGIGDVNGDHTLDLVLVKGRHWPGTSRVFLGKGDGTFPTTYNLTHKGYRSYSGSLADVDGDGSLDVVLSNDAPDPTMVLLNDGEGRFRRGAVVGQAAWPTRNAAVADLNGDRAPDIVIANRGAGVFQHVCLNQGRGSFDTCTAFAEYSATTITPADIEGDGDLDLVVPHRDRGQGFVFLNDGTGRFLPLHRIPFGPVPSSVRVADTADVDGDSRLDIVTVDDLRRAVEISFANGAGGFDPPVRLDAGNAVPYALEVADLDLDGHSDILVGFVEARSAIFFGDGTRRFTRTELGDANGTVYGFAVADLDSDGFIDIAAARSEATSMLYFGGPGAR